MGEELLLQQKENVMTMRRRRRRKQRELMEGTFQVAKSKDYEGHFGRLLYCTACLVKPRDVGERERQPCFPDLANLPSRGRGDEKRTELHRRLPTVHASLHAHSFLPW